MVGRRGRPPKRKVDELQDDHDGKPKSAKEARIEAISLDASEPAHLTLMTLGPSVWSHQDAAEEWSEDHTSPISEAEEGREGMQSQGTCWKGVPYPPVSQVVLSSKRISNGEAFDCETQTFHFNHMSPSTVVVVADSDTPEAIKVEIDANQGEELVSHPLNCCVEGCATSSDTETASTFYTVPVGSDRSLWAETLCIKPCTETDVRQHVCSKHFIMPKNQALTPKGKVRKKKTCDMLVAEEAEKIKQGLASGRPKRTPKPNKNYNWAEIVPLIKAEPDELDDDEIAYLKSGSPVNKTGSSVLKVKEDKENKRPTSDTDGLPEKEDEEGEEEEDLENISLPSDPRPPPPKPKGRPHRIRDSCAQTDGDFKSPLPRCPLREVKVQCTLTSQPPSPCTSCSYLNWLRLEELLAECATKVEGNLCASPVQECLRKVVGSVSHPSHATNVLKLLMGEKRDALENTSDIVLVPSQEDEVEIESVIHPEVEEPMTGLREITPRTWQKKTKWKKALAEKQVVSKEEEEEEEDLDGLGIQEATEMDDEEFHPGYLEDEETDEEDEQGLDDEDWTIDKQDRESRPGAKKKQKKIPQHTKGKKGRESPGGEAEGREVEVRESGSEDSQDNLGRVDPGVVTEPELCVPKEGVLRVQESGHGQQRRTHRKSRVENDGRWLRGAFKCPKCELVFSTILKMEQHHQHIHLGVPSWKGNHLCEECGKTFTQKVGLQVHRMHKHGDPKKFPCHLCSFLGVTKAKLARHLKSHTNHRLLTCEVCGTGLKTMDTYKNHMALHTNQGRYQCSVCKKAFNHKQYYDDHYRSHFSLREYNCHICKMSFKTSKSVRTHVRAVHLNDKRMVCPVCGARFMTNFNLRGHMKKHSRYEPIRCQFQCGYCLVKFHTRGELLNHQVKKHNVYPEEHHAYHVRVESDNYVCVRLVSESEQEGEESARRFPQLRHVVVEGGTDESICEVISPEKKNVAVHSEHRETVEGIEAVEVEQHPKQPLTVIHVYDASK